MRLSRRVVSAARAVIAGTAIVAGTAVTAGTATVPVSVALPAADAAAAVRASAWAGPQVRVNQVGYEPGSPKLAYAMLHGPVPSVRYVVLRDGRRLATRTSTTDLGAWSPGYRAVYALDFSSIRLPGRYAIELVSPVHAISPSFEIGTGSALYTHLVDNAVRYFTSERDGPQVVSSVLGRQPANLTDEAAMVYADPRYDANDNLIGGLHRIGGPVNVAGGWFDAGGGYEKFAYTAAYADGLMLLAARDFPHRYPTLLAEADFGLAWLHRLFDPVRKVLYVQVGIGNGNSSNTLEGDYNFWFLPQREDHLGAKPGSPDYFVEYRPVFEAAPPGQRISPDLAGRFAADFALAAQLEAASAPRAAAAQLAEAREVFALAKTSGVSSIVTAFPHDYYPGSQWRSDMMWGAAEIALADEALHVSSARLIADVKVAVRWGRAYLAEGHGPGSDTLNLYDTGALGDAELLAATAQHRSGAIARARLLADLAAQLRVGEEAARGDPFGLGTALGSSDASPHAFGLFVTNALYERAGGSSAFAAFAERQLDYALGANPWGTSFVVGAGTVFPHCMQSEIANLAGSLTGAPPLQLGATVDGPSSPPNFSGLGTVPGMRACRFGTYAPFDNARAAYEDNVVSWPSVEPADDYTAASLLAFAFAAG